MRDPFAPEPEILQRQIERAGAGKILDVGPGPNLFPPATHSVDWKEWPGCRVAPVHAILDFSREPLPGQDLFGFVYCRHVVEDLRNPEGLFENINRIARRGYIETPTVCHELTVGVDAGSKWRGHFHHHWFCWVEGDVLHLLTKNVAASFVAMVLPEAYPRNLYYEFEDGIRYQIHELGKDCELSDNSYWRSLERASK